MNLNLTLIGQAITFVVFIWLFQRYVYAPIHAAMANRKQRIEEGLEAAEQGQKEQELAEKRARETIAEAKEKAQEMVTAAERRANEIREEATSQARQEADRILANAREEAEQEKSRAREELKQQVADLAVEGAEKILEREIDEKAHSEVLDRLVNRL